MKVAREPGQDEIRQLRRSVTRAEYIRFGLTDLQGKKYSLSDFRGKKVLLVFWATWCAPCVREVPELIFSVNSFIIVDLRNFVKYLFLQESLLIQGEIALHKAGACCAQ